MPMPFIIQRHSEPDSCCDLYALCNALRAMGRTSPEPGDEQWKRLVTVAGCEHGTAINADRAALELGLVRIPIDPDDCVREAPSTLVVYNPEPGSTLHAILVVGGNDNGPNVVNWRGDRGPALQNVTWEDLRLPPKGNPNRRAWSIRSLAKERVYHLYVPQAQDPTPVILVGPMHRPGGGELIEGRPSRGVYAHAKGDKIIVNRMAAEQLPGSNPSDPNARVYHLYVAQAEDSRPVVLVGPMHRPGGGELIEGRPDQGLYVHAESGDKIIVNRTTAPEFHER